MFFFSATSLICWKCDQKLLNFPEIYQTVVYGRDEKGVVNGQLKMQLTFAFQLHGSRGGPQERGGSRWPLRAPAEVPAQGVQLVLVPATSPLGSAWSTFGVSGHEHNLLGFILYTLR